MALYDELIVTEDKAEQDLSAPRTDESSDLVLPIIDLADKSWN